MMKPKLLFYCQHILGMGHFIRSAAIARGLAGDFDVHFVNGGEVVAGFELPSSIETIQLPPIKSDADMRHLHAAADDLSLGEIKDIRRRRLLAEYERLRPEVLLIELFPFGRRKFKDELLPLLERAKEEGKRTKVVCSLRDILVARRDQQQFEEETCRIINRYFDLILVHADPRLQRLNETFARVADLRCQIYYTGLVHAPTSEEATKEATIEAARGAVEEAAREAVEVSAGKRAGDERGLPEDLPSLAKDEKLILVSIGGGRVGGELIECAIETSQLIGDRLPHRLLVFTGPYFPEQEFKSLLGRTAGKRRIVLRRYTTHLAPYLRAADLSLSMAGYNTCLDLIAAGVRAIVYPFVGDGEQEQTVRAKKLRALGLVEVIAWSELTPWTLAEKIWSTLDRPRPGPNRAALDLGGVGKTASALRALIAGGSLSAASAWTALDRRLARLGKERREVKIFFRDDDVDEDEESLEALVELFLSRAVPLNLAIIPARLTEGGAAYLRERRRAYPGLIELNQHGWRHINHEASGRKCEFGPSRSYEDQLSDIAAGRRVLEAAFGADFSPVFVPPWNRCTVETLRVLKALAFRALSGAGKSASMAGLCEIPVTLDLYGWKGGPRLRPEAELVDELGAQLERGARIGIMLHHKMMDDGARRLIGRMLDALKGARVSSFHTFESLLAK